MSERRSTPGEAGIMISIAIVVAGLLWAIAWMATQAPQTSTAKDDGNRHASAQQSDRGSGPIEGQQGTPPYKPSCGPSYSKDEDDLCQQRRMAKAAERSADIALWQTVIGGVGAALVIPALVLSAISAWGAVKAVRVTRETAERQLRAYLSCSKITFSNVDSGETPTADVEVSNSGATPAFETIVRCGLAIFPYPQRAGNAVVLAGWEDTTSRGIAAPGDKIFTHGTLKGQFRRADLEAIRDGSSALYAVIDISYRDIHEKRCSLTQWFAYTKDNITTGNAHGSICAHGNSYRYGMK